MSLPALTRRRAILVAAVGVVVLLLAGRFVAGVGAPQAAAPAADAPPAAEILPPQRLVVHVVGAVRRPGLYRFDQGARIADALSRAGGPTPRADLTLVNLAAPLADGTQVVVHEKARPPTAAGDVGAAAPSGSAAAPGGVVHLNTATLEQLDALPGVGPVTAQKILEYRNQHGAFGSVDELDAIPGIGPARLEQLREVVAP